MAILSLVQILSAILLLFFGRKLYWFFVGAAGFFVFTEWALNHMHGGSQLLLLLIGLGIGVIGAMLAVFLRSAGIGLVGLFGGIYLFLNLADLINISGAIGSIVMIVIGGVVGLILVFILFDWALIILSTVSGASILSEFISVEGLLGWIVLIGLIIIGIVVQAKNLAKK